MATHNICFVYDATIEERLRPTDDGDDFAVDHELKTYPEDGGTYKCDCEAEFDTKREALDHLADETDFKNTRRPWQDITPTEYKPLHEFTGASDATTP